MAANFGGYDYSFVDKNLERYTCSAICTRVLRDPFLTGCCGQHFCESCLGYWFAEHYTESCPHCRAEGENFQILYDKKLKREIDSLRIHCTNKEEGCEWIGEMQFLQKHLNPANAYGCGYIEVECSNSCEGATIFVPLKMKRKDLDNHLKNVCPLRPYQCEHCGYKDTYENITGGYYENYAVTTLSCHYNICTEFPLECPNRCGTNNIKRKDMKNHRGQCPEEKIECPNKCQPKAHKKMGEISRKTFVRRKNLAKHLSGCTHRPYKCEYCGLKGPHYLVTSTHYEKCTEFLLQCPNWCGRNDIKRKDMEDHRSQCPEEPVQCPFEEAGCKQKLVQHEMEQHMSANQQQHLLMVLGAYKEMKIANEEMKQDYKEMKKAYVKMESAHKETTKELHQVKRELSQTKAELKQTKDNHQAQNVKQNDQQYQSIFKHSSIFDGVSDDDDLFGL